MKLVFWIIPNKADAHGEYPTYCRITINGQRAEISTGIFVHEKDFDQKKSHMKGNGNLRKPKTATLTN